MKRNKHMLLILIFLFTLILSAGTAMAAVKAPKKIKLNKKKVTLTVGKSYKLKATVSPKKANKKVKWKSSNKKVVSVTSKGKITAKKVGKAAITCTSKANKKIKAKCTVTVKKAKAKTKPESQDPAAPKPDTPEPSETVPLKKLTLYDKAKGFDLTGGILLDIGFEYTPGVKYDPSDATYKDVKWTSSDTSVFTVDQNGKCTGVGGGTATLTCTSVKYPTIKTECPVEVMKPRNVQDDEDLLAKTKNILSRTCEPFYRKLQGGSISSKYDASGYLMWNVTENLNGTMKYVFAYEPGTYNVIGATYCLYSSPVITLNSETSAPSDVRSALREGTYDFASDPADVTIGWSMWTSETTKAELQKMLNGTISDEIFNQLKTYKSGTGKSVIIVYGKNAAGALCGKYAGSVNYNSASNAAVYNLVGVDSENEEIYGKQFNGIAEY